MGWEGEVPNQFERGGGAQYKPTDPSHVHGSTLLVSMPNKGAGRYQTSSREGGGRATKNPGGGSAKDWVAKVMAHWNAMRAKNPAYTYKEALIAMRGH